jgi:O-acetyl-ADP-ribose deacetylase (regulator of RNase III)
LICNQQVAGSIPVIGSMYMRYEQKDIITVTAPGLIAHGVNCQNAMGSGVARALYMQWHKVKTEYHTFGSMVLGDAQFVEVEPGLVVANCFTQERYGRDGRKYASLRAVRESLEDAAKYALDELGVREVHIPKIGCGLGGLDWDLEVEPMLMELEESTARTYPVIFVVCEV